MLLYSSSLMASLYTVIVTWKLLKTILCGNIIIEQNGLPFSYFMKHLIITTRCSRWLLTASQKYSMYRIHELSYTQQPTTERCLQGFSAIATERPVFQFCFKAGTKLA